MSLTRVLCLTLIAALSPAAPLEASETPPTKVEIEKALEAARKYTEPGESHRVLARFLGTWDTETRLQMAPAGSKPEKGTITYRWLMEGRWLQGETSGTMMGYPLRTFVIMGYDNFKMSYVTSSVSSFDTALLTSEGDMDPAGKALITYGTLDEYLTGENDKMVKYVWRFLSDDEIKLEVHDLPIGEKNTMVLEISCHRRKGG